MEYKVEEIGARFTSQNIKSLEQKFSKRAEEGYHFHSVIHITKSGCLGLSNQYTYLAVYIKE